MGRLIDADKLKAHYAWWKGGGREMTMDEAKNDFDTIIDLQPTVELKPIKHGRWIKFDYYLGIDVYKCSECGMKIEISPNCDGTERFLGKFCENCGARMDAQIGEDKSHPFAESVMMGMDEVEE